MRSTGNTGEAKGKTKEKPREHRRRPGNTREPQRKTGETKGTQEKPRERKSRTGNTTGKTLDEHSKSH